MILDISLDPPDSIGYQANPFVGIELFDRQHQADVSFLNQVKHFEPIMTVLIGDLDYESEIGGDQGVRFNAFSSNNVTACRCSSSSVNTGNFRISGQIERQTIRNNRLICNHCLSPYF